jgi:bud emergence protein 1
LLTRVFIQFKADRARDLSKYCQDLLKLPRYLAESPWVQDQLFGIHEGDIETEIDPSIGTSNSTTIDTTTTTTTSATPKTPVTPMTPMTPMTPNNTTTTGSSTIKVKIMYKDEIFAIKVPVPSTIEFLKDKIMDRLGFEVQLQYKSGDRLSDLNTETFEAAVKLGKLTVVAS